MKLLMLLILLLPISATAQPQHVGLLLNGQFEEANSGNGTIVGVEAQNTHNFKVKGNYFNATTNAQFTIDEKSYRNQFGGAVRLTSLVRYFDKKNQVVFVQGGINVGGIYFSDTPNSDDGYIKYVARPVAGGGLNIVRDNYSIVVDYQFLFKRKLMAQKNELSDFRNRIIDGWSSGQKVTLRHTLRLNQSQWLLLINANGGRYTYQRNPGVYGPQLGSVVHRYNAYEISVGVGREY